MARPGYISLYADERTQQIFDEFVKIKGITKSTALSEMMEVYMLSQDEELYLELKKKALGIETARQELFERTDTRTVNDYIFIKLGTTYGQGGVPLDGKATIEAYINNMETNGLGYSWFSTRSLHFGMSKKKVAYYNSLAQKGEEVTLLFAIGEDINDICYSATVLEIQSSKDLFHCPDVSSSVPEELGSEETGKIWIKIRDLRKEDSLKASMFYVRSTDSNLKQVISESQFHFGYVYLLDNNVK